MNLKIFLLRLFPNEQFWAWATFALNVWVDLNFSQFYLWLQEMQAKHLNGRKTISCSRTNGFAHFLYLTFTSLAAVYNSNYRSRKQIKIWIKHDMVGAGFFPPGAILLRFFKGKQLAFYAKVELLTKFNIGIVFNTLHSQI